MLSFKKNKEVTMRFLPIILLASILPCLPVLAGDENQNTNTLEQYSIIETTIPSDEIQKILTTIQKTHPFDSTFKFKQQALNTFMCKGVVSEAFCKLYTKDKVLIFHKNKLDEITAFPIKILTDTENLTIFKAPFSDKKNKYIRITPYSETENCTLKVTSLITSEEAFTQFGFSLEYDFSLDLPISSEKFSTLDRSCPLSLLSQEVYSRNEIEQIEKNLKRRILTNRAFQFKQKALNYLVCDTHQMDYPVCELYLKGVEASIALKDADKGNFLISLNEVVEDTPTRTIFKYTNAKGDVFYSKYEPKGNQASPCVLFFVSTTRDNIEDLDTMKNVSFSTVQSLAPFCNNFYKY